MLVSPVRQPSLGVQLVDQLRALIVRGELATGTHLVEGRLAAEFGVSRGPVRDALRQLELEGLVESRSRGLSVRGLDDRDLDELYEVREALEQVAVAGAIARAGEADWSVLDRAVAAMRAAGRSGDAAAFAAADLDFHSGLYELAGNRRLGATWALHRPLFAAMLGVTNTDRDLDRVAQDHEDLAAVVRSGRKAQARTVLTQHLATSRERLQQVLAARRTDVA